MSRIDRGEPKRLLNRNTAVAKRDRHGHTRNRDVEIRMKHARLELQLRKGGYTHADMARDVSILTGRDKPYNHSAAVRWLQGVIPDDLNAQIAIADVLGVNANWLYWGRGYRYPRPEDLREIEPIPPSVTSQKSC